jgi:hypothetical protein
MTIFTAYLSTDEQIRIDARGFDDAAAKLRIGKELPRDKKVVVGIENPVGKSRFFLKREDGTMLFPISAAVAAFESGNV